MPSKETDTNEAELRAAADAGDPDAMYRLGYALAERDEDDEAERWYQRAADGGSAGAMWALGDRAECREEFGEAERWFQRSAEAGNASGMCRLGNLLFERGEYEQADRWLRAAVDGDHEHAVWRMAQVSELLDRHDTDRWFRRLDDTYELEAESLHIFGVLRDARHREEEAAYWYGRAAEAGHTDSLERLPALLRKLGDSAETERWYRFLADAGDANAMFELGHVLAGRGDLNEAERWFRKAIEDSDAVARRLGEVLDHEAFWSWNEDDAAKVREAMDRLPLAQVLTLHRAADRGDPDVWWELGSALDRCGYRDHGKGWRWSAAGEGHLRALYEVTEYLRAEDPAVVEELLAVDLDNDELYEDCELQELEFPCAFEQVLTAWDRQDKHEPEFRRAADSGHPKVMMWLGILLIHWGDEQEGQNWLQRAAEAGYPDAMYSLTMLLDGQGRHDDAQPWREQVTEYRRQVAEKEAFYEWDLGEYKFDREHHQRLAEITATSYRADLRDSVQERQRLLAAT